MNNLDYTSLDISRRLKDAGIVFPEEPSAWWYMFRGIGWELHHDYDITSKKKYCIDVIPARSVGELGRMLIETIIIYRGEPYMVDQYFLNDEYRLRLEKVVFDNFTNEWKRKGEYYHSAISTGQDGAMDKSEADARALMLLWLHEHGYLKEETHG